MKEDYKGKDRHTFVYLSIGVVLMLTFVHIKALGEVAVAFLALLCCRNSHLESSYLAYGSAIFLLMPPLCQLCSPSATFLNMASVVLAEAITEQQ